MVNAKSSFVKEYYWLTIEAWGTPVTCRVEIKGRIVFSRHSTNEWR